MSRLTSIPTDTQRVREQALDWWVRRQDRAWTARDESAFQHWLAQHVTHEQVYAQCARRWTQLDAMPADLLAGMRQRLAVDKAREAASAGGPARHAPAQQSPSRRRFLVWPAASAMAAAAVGGVGFVVWQHQQTQPLSVQAYQTERGQQQTVTLGDGSQLRMDSATQLEVRMHRHRREVHLRVGQAVFSVQHDGRPFHVLAGSTRVTVVGTRFSVRHTPGIPGDPGVQVAVEEGQVRVAAFDVNRMRANDGDLQAGTLLVAGEQTVADALGRAGPVTALAPAGMAPWRHQRVSFEDAPLAQVLAEFERYGATGLRVADAQVGALRLSGTFDPMAVDALRQALPRALPVRLVVRDGITEVVSARTR